MLVHVSYALTNIENKYILLSSLKSYMFLFYLFYYNSYIIKTYSLSELLIISSVLQIQTSLWKCSVTHFQANEESHVYFLSHDVLSAFCCNHFMFTLLQEPQIRFCLCSTCLKCISDILCHPLFHNSECNLVLKRLVFRKFSKYVRFRKVFVQYLLIHHQLATVAGLSVDHCVFELSSGTPHFHSLVARWSLAAPAHIQHTLRWLP